VYLSPQGGCAVSSADTGADRPRRLLFMLKNGPVYALSDHIEHQLRALGPDLDCEVWSQGPVDLEETPAPGLHARVVGTGNQSSLAAIARYVWILVKRIRVCARQYPGSVAVLAHDPTKNGLIGMLVAAVARAPLMVEVNGVYGNPDNYGLAGRQGGRFKRQMLRIIARIVLDRAAAVRCFFPGQLSGFVRLPARAALRFFFDLPSLDRFRQCGEHPTVLFVGFPFFTKGVDVLIQAFEQVAPDFPQWELLLIGHELEEPVRACTTNPRVRVLRAMTNEQLAEHVNRAGVFVLPSRSEAMGRVLLEAAAAGKPRIGARVGGIPTVIRDGVDGLLFEKEDVRQLADCLRALMASTQLRSSLGEAARRRVETEFSSAAYRGHVKDMVEAAFVVHAACR
jgi:glycosyltransferase involved in cell wall biosynthesis